MALFLQKLGWQQERVTTNTLRYWMFVTAGALVDHARKRILQLSVSPGQRDCWRRVWEKIASPYLTAMQSDMQPHHPEFEIREVLA